MTQTSPLWRQWQHLISSWSCLAYWGTARMTYLAVLSHPGLNIPKRLHLIIISSLEPWGFTIGQAPYRPRYRVHKIYPVIHLHREICSLFFPLTHIFVAGAFKRGKEKEKQLFDGYWRAWDGGSSSPGWEGLIGSAHVRRSDTANKCNLSESYGNKGMNHIALITIDEV